MVAKLSKLQRFIMLEAAKSLPGLEEKAKKINEWRQGAVAIGFLKDGLKPIQPTDLPHITRNFILTNFFKLSLRTMRFGGQLAAVYGCRITDQDTDRIDAEAAGEQYNRANASLYRAIKRLEHRGLIRRMAKMRGDLQLTAKGIAVANEVKPERFPVSTQTKLYPPGA
jgi:hypothetical protein